MEACHCRTDRRNLARAYKGVVKFPHDFARASKDTEFLSSAKRQTHEFFSQTHMKERCDGRGYVLVMPNKRLVRPRRMFSAFQEPKSRGILDSTGLSSLWIVMVPANGGPRRSGEKNETMTTTKGGKWNDAGCAAMKRGTDDAKGRLRVAEEREEPSTKIVWSPPTYRGTKKQADSVSVILGVKEKIRPAWLSFGIVNFYDKYSLFHMVLCSPHLFRASIEESNASSRRCRASYFRLYVIAAITQLTCLSH